MRQIRFRQTLSVGHAAGMADRQFVERCIAAAFDRVTSSSTPRRLRAAMHYTVFSGGGRLRPRLALKTAEACGDAAPEAARAAAVAIEFLHCASLVHDDLPCFDDAPLRRGRPTVHVEFGEELAVLAGDGLIVAAFDVLAHGCRRDAHLLGDLIQIIATGVGAVRGIVAGQAWESEPDPDVWTVHATKTAALFEAAMAAGALTGGGDPQAWRPIGAALGSTYQVADDIQDIVGSPGKIGKPIGQDALLERPSAALELGLDGAYRRLEKLRARLCTLVPASPRSRDFTAWLSEQCDALFPHAAAPLESASLTA